MPDPNASPTPGDSESAPKIPDFDLIRPIGRGGFGQVWLARNQTTGHLRAVKVIPMRHSGVVDAAGREITSLTRLEAKLRPHPHLLNIHHVGKTTEYLFYVMDPADDLSGAAASSDPDYRPATLASRLAAGPLSPDECERYSHHLLEGLSSLHAAGMVHRDVKPANCLFINGGLKLADFGLLTEASPLISRVGTQKYMPPDGRMDARADVYAAGLVLYEMVTGLPADSFPRLGDRAIEVARTPILCVLIRIALLACEPNPQERFLDAGQMLAALVACRREVPTGRTLPRRRTIAIAGGLLLALVLGALATWATREPRVHVNFATYPFEATIYLDGTLLIDASGKAYTTPCTVDDLPARVHHVVFKCEGWRDLDIGSIDFACTRQIVGRWPHEPQQ